MSAFRAVLLLAALAATACTSWRRAETFEGWTLYGAPGVELDADRWQAVFDPALAAVEATFGPFEDRVRVHAWRGGVTLAADGRRIVATDDATVQDVPGIGPARVQGYHARGGLGPFSRGGIFVGDPEAGTAVHELVHARVAELDERWPLWFEEGVATWFGDGALVGGRWTTDGFACWPWRELRENPLTDDELAALLALGANDATSVRDNVLVHFVGWAIVFDLARETRSDDWRVWLATFERDGSLRDARRRMARTLLDATPDLWLRRLEDPDPAVRFATAKGTWKLARVEVVEALVTALERETDGEVAVALAVNLLAAANDLDLSGPTAWRVRRASRETLREAELADPLEQRAVDALFVEPAAGRPVPPVALETLRRFWAE
jgi:hypothetical protein